MKNNAPFNIAERHAHGRVPQLRDLDRPDYMAVPINLGTIGNPELGRAGSPLPAAEQHESSCGAHPVSAGRPTKIGNGPLCRCHCDLP